MKIVLEFDENSLTYTDAYLACLWHAAQWNPAPGDDREACRTAELIGREIIRRWLDQTPPELWHRQGSHEKSLPSIERSAKLQNVLSAARDVAEKDHGANTESFRAAAIGSVERLAEELAAFDAMGSKGLAP